MASGKVPPAVLARALALAGKGQTAMGRAEPVRSREPAETERQGGNSAKRKIQAKLKKLHPMD